MFEKFNINPKGRKTGDCTTRAIATAACITWQEALRMQYETALYSGYSVGSTENTDRVLQQLAFIPCKVAPARGEKRPTVHELADHHNKNTLVISVAGHLTCAINGTYFDLWDCGNKSVYKF